MFLHTLACTCIHPACIVYTYCIHSVYTRPKRRVYTECIQYVCEQLRVVYDCIHSAPFVAVSVLYASVCKLRLAPRLYAPFPVLSKMGAKCIHIVYTWPPFYLPETCYCSRNPTNLTPPKRCGELPKHVFAYTLHAHRHAECIHIVYTLHFRPSVCGLYTLCCFAG